MISSFLGVIVEMIWCLIKNGYIASRQGVIYGPFNPLYGIGAILITYFLLPIKDKKNIYLFLGGLIIGSLLEYIVHFGQVLFFKTYSWNYSQKILNLNGRIDILHSIFWGLLAILWIKKIFPVIKKLVAKINPDLNKWLMICIASFMILNMSVSMMAIARWSARTRGIAPITYVDKFLDRKYDDEFLKKVFPNMRIIKNDNRKKA